MAFSIVQSAEGTSTSATVTATLSTAPTSGNLIVLAFAADDYNGTPNAGWTQSTGMEQQTFHGGYLWWQISNGSNSFQYTIGSATNSAWVLLEISGADSAAPYDISSGQFAQSASVSYTTPSLVPSTGSRLLIAMLGGSQNATVNMSTDFTSWTNSFTHIRSSGPASASGTRDCVGVASLVVTGNGSTSFSTGATFPSGTNPDSRSGLIIAFKPATGGGSTTPQAVTVSSTSSTTFLRSTGKKAAVTSTSSTALVKGAGKIIAATSTTAATFKRAVAKAFAATSATSATASTVAKAVSKKITAASVSSAAVLAQRAFLVTVSAAATTATSLSRQTRKVVSVSSASAISIKRAIARTIPVLSSGAVTVTRSIAKRISAALSLGTVINAVFNLFRIIVPTPIDPQRIAVASPENRRVETATDQARSAQTIMETRSVAAPEENRSASAVPNSRTITPPT